MHHLEPAALARVVAGARLVNVRGDGAQARDVRRPAVSDSSRKPERERAKADGSGGAEEARQPGVQSKGEWTCAPQVDVMRIAELACMQARRAGGDALRRPQAFKAATCATSTFAFTVRRSM